MSTIDAIECKCAVCGAENKLIVLNSTNEFGAPDLDLRPPEMKRSTMPLWIQECACCGYVSQDISEQSGVSITFLRSERFRTCDGLGLQSDLARKFYKSYMINCDQGRYVEAFFDVLHAAWACDDAEDTQGARVCRELAIHHLPTLIKQNAGDKDTLTLMGVDLLRRSGRFDEVVSNYQGVHFSEDLLNRILSFEIEKAKEKDSNCYTVSDVVEN